MSEENPKKRKVDVLNGRVAPLFNGWADHAIGREAMALCLRLALAEGQRRMKQDSKIQWRMKWLYTADKVHSIQIF
jgi:hypothetical protein